MILKVIYLGYKHMIQLCADAIVYNLLIICLKVEHY